MSADQIAAILASIAQTDRALAAVRLSLKSRRI
jgi:hypothetical protein